MTDVEKLMEHLRRTLVAHLPGRAATRFTALVIDQVDGIIRAATNQAKVERDEAIALFDDACIDCGPCADSAGAGLPVKHLPPACGEAMVCPKCEKLEPLSCLDCHERRQGRLHRAKGSES